jgi:hypothetical protein
LNEVGLEGFASYSGKGIDKLGIKWEKWLKIHFSICEEHETIGATEQHAYVVEEISYLPFLKI